MEYLNFLSGLGCGLCIGLSLFAFKKYFNAVTALQKYSSKEEYKLVLVVRSDLNMTKGKIAAQCGHASVNAFEKMQKRNKEELQKWKRTGQAKIALKTDSVDEIHKIADNAKKNGLLTTMVRDAGRTQIAPNSITVLSVGPAPKDLVDKVTGHLKLL